MQKPESSKRKVYKEKEQIEAKKLKLSSLSSPVGQDKSTLESRHSGVRAQKIEDQKNKFNQNLESLNELLSDGGNQIQEIFFNTICGSPNKWNQKLQFIECFLEDTLESKGRVEQLNKLVFRTKLSKISAILAHSGNTAKENFDKLLNDDLFPKDQLSWFDKLNAVNIFGMPEKYKVQFEDIVSIISPIWVTTPSCLQKLSDQLFTITGNYCKPSTKITNINEI